MQHVTGVLDRLFGEKHQEPTTRSELSKLFALEGSDPLASVRSPGAVEIPEGIQKKEALKALGTLAYKGGLEIYRAIKEYVAETAPDQLENFTAIENATAPETVEMVNETIKQLATNPATSETLKNVTEAIKNAQELSTNATVASTLAANATEAASTLATNTTTASTLGANITAATELKDIAKSAADMASAAKDTVNGIVEGVCEAGSFGSTIKSGIHAIATSKWMPAFIGGGIITGLGLAEASGLPIHILIPLAGLAWSVISGVAGGAIRWTDNKIRGFRETYQNAKKRKSDEAIAAADRALRDQIARREYSKSTLDSARAAFESELYLPLVQRMAAYRALQNKLLQEHKTGDAVAQSKLRRYPARLQAEMEKRKTKRNKMRTRLTELNTLQDEVEDIRDNVLAALTPQELATRAEPIRTKTRDFARTHIGFGKIGKSTRRTKRYPWQIKGSAAAKERMAYLRSLRRS